MEFDIHNYRHKLDRKLELIRKTRKICEENKLDILKFHNDGFSRGLSLPRIEKYLFHMYHISLILKKPFREVTKDDIKKLVAVIEQRDYSEWTKKDFCVVLKIFFRWLRDKEEYPEEVKWIKTTVKHYDRKLPEDLLTQEEVKKLAEAADNIRDKAFILALYESGCRIGELLSLKIKNVSFDNYGAVIILKGKTGGRRVRVVASSPALANWISNHPFRNDSDSPLWILIGSRNKNQIMKYSSVCSLLKRLKERTGLKKRLYPHLFRHSRATFLANHFTEAQVKEYMGWIQGSKMASIYIHLAGRDIDEAVLKLNGLIREDKENNGVVISLLKCPRCNLSNDNSSKFCSHCGFVLDQKTAMEWQIQVKEYMARIKEIKERLR